MADRRSDKISGKDWRLVNGKWVRSYGASPGAAITRPYKKFIKGAKDKIKKAGDALKTRRDNRKKELIGKGTAKNPQFKTNNRGRKVSNPSYTPPTKQTTKVKKTTPPNNKSNANTSSNKPKFQNRVSGNGGSKETKKTTPPPKKDAWKTAAAKEWLKNTKRSPAAKHFSPQERWALQQKHRAWKAKRGR